MNQFEITPEMIVAFGKHFGTTSIDDVPGIVGSLYSLANGVGELPAELVDAEETRGIFAQLRSRFFASKGVAEPEYSVIEKAPVVEEAPAVEEAAPVVEEVVVGETPVETTQE